MKDEQKKIANEMKKNARKTQHNEWKMFVLKVKCLCYSTTKRASISAHIQTNLNDILKIIPQFQTNCVCLFCRIFGNNPDNPQ